MIEESYTADLSALQHLPEHEDHQEAFDPTCATTGVQPDPGPGDLPFGVSHPVDDAGQGPDGDGPDQGTGHEHDPAEHHVEADDPRPEPEPYGVGH